MLEPSTFPHEIAVLLRVPGRMADSGCAAIFVGREQPHPPDLALAPNIPKMINSSKTPAALNTASNLPSGTVGWGTVPAVAAAVVAAAPAPLPCLLPRRSLTIWLSFNTLPPVGGVQSFSLVS